jgi:RHS repeat-associated protein
VEVGVSPVLFYDPLGRVVATLHPNHTWEKVDFDPWRQTSWDVNDTVFFDPATDEHVGGYFRRLPPEDYLPTWHALRTNPAHADAAESRWPVEQQRNAEADAANKAAAHADTPSIVHLDSLGRPFLTIAHNGGDDRPETRTEQDIEGAPLRIIDARGNAVMVYQVEPDDPGAVPVIGHDVAGRQLFEHSMDAGDRRMLPDIAGQPIRQWDARGHRFRFEYDELRRPLRSFVAGGEVGDTEQLFQRTVYGESRGVELNHRGKVYQLFDQAGVVTNVEYDFKGNMRRGSRQFTTDYRNRVDWSQNPALDDDETFISHTTYDALNRPTTLTSPDASITLPGYNEAGLLERMVVRLQGTETPTEFVENIDYNAKGQRESIVYATADGHSLTTTYDYDPETFRLTNLRTQRHRDGRVLQDLHYAYDPAGNITSILDNAQQTVFFNNSPVEPHSEYTYDALYRLIRAEGREHAAQHNHQRDATDTDWLIGIPFPNSPQALQRYVQQYAYDQVGNILSMQHSGGEVLRWNRRYQYAEDTNRLLATSRPGDEDNVFSDPYEYDSHGNMTRMPHLPLMQFDFLDQLRATSRTEMNNGGIPQTTFYVYDARGQRVRKVTDRQAGPEQTPSRQHERVYLGGFGVYREFENNGQTISLERQTLHVMDDQQQVAQIDTRTIGNDDSPQQIRRFQLGNHLGSVAIEVDENATEISFEEFHPYGTTALRMTRSVNEGSLKRYRYTRKERDEENGLYYHGARYYACWLGRWTAADPIGIGDGMNVFLYVRANPIVLMDFSGMNGVRTYLDPNASATEIAQQFNARLNSIEPESQAHIDLISELNSLPESLQRDVLSAIANSKDTNEATFEQPVNSQNRTSASPPPTPKYVPPQDQVGYIMAKNALGLVDVTAQIITFGGLEYGEGVPELEEARNSAGAIIGQIGSLFLGKVGGRSKAKGKGPAKRQKQSRKDNSTTGKTKRKRLTEKMEDWLNEDAAVEDPKFEKLSLKDKFFSELGKKSLPDAVYEKYKHITDPVARGKQIWRDMGLKSLGINIRAIRNQWNTGTTPATRALFNFTLDIALPSFKNYVGAAVKSSNRPDE